MRRRRALIGLHRCRLGLPEDARGGWVVRYGGSLLAVLSDAAEGEVSLAAGFREPFKCVGISWPDLASARADFIDVARLYRAGVDPNMITLDLKDGTGPVS